MYIFLLFFLQIHLFYFISISNIKCIYLCILFNLFVVDTGHETITHSTLGAYLDEDGEVQQERVIYSEDEQISLALELSIE